MALRVDDCRVDCEVYQRSVRTGVPIRPWEASHSLGGTYPHKGERCCGSPPAPNARAGVPARVATDLRHR